MRGTLHPNQQGQQAIARLAGRLGLGVPLVAIGGITLDNAREVVAAGADCIAVISDLFDAPDIAARARDFARLFDGVAAQA